jgi:hypothetical protein
VQNLDVDGNGNGQVGALTDALLILRAAYGGQLRLFFFLMRISAADIELSAASRVRHQGKKSPRGCRGLFKLT